MPLGVIYRVLFGFWGNFWRKLQKGKTLAVARLRCPKGHPSGTPQRRHCSQREIFGFCFRAPRFRTPIV